LSRPSRKVAFHGVLLCEISSSQSSPVPGQC
jgi:hypothetical protein